MKLSGNTILVTGGSSGIGEAIAQRFHDMGNTVIVAGRRQDALDAATNGRADMHGMTFDAATADGIAGLAGRVVADFPDLNVVFNNAGIMEFEKIDGRRDLADAEAQIATNLLGPIRLADALVDHLKSRPDAALINTTSGLAFVPAVGAATYSAIKAAIHSYTISLRAALKGRVEVIEWAPPALRTGLTPGQEKNEAFMPLDEFIEESLTLFAQRPTPAEIIVDRTRFFRDAEAEHRFDEAFAALNAS